MATPIATIQTGPASAGAKPVATVGPKPQQLRAGTGSLWGDIKQDAANIFLPERFAADIAKNQNPGSETYQDDQGNWILRRKDGSEFYLNEPGFGMQDLLNITGAFAVPGAGAKAVATALPKAYTAVKTAAAYNPLWAGIGAGAAYSAAEQGVGATLTDQEVSPLEIAIGGLGGGAIPGAQKYIGGPLLSGLSRVTGVEALRNPIKAALYGIERVRTPSGQLTSTAKEALEAAGIKWQNFTPEQIALANDRAVDVLGMNTQARGRAIGLSTIGVDEPTKGMVGQMPNQIAREAQGEFRGAREAAVRQLQDVGDTLGRPDNLESVGSRLVDINQQQSRELEDAFDTARRVGERAPVSRKSLETLKTNMLAAMRRDLSKDQIDAAMKSFPTSSQGDTGVSQIETIRSLYEWRRDHLGVDATGKAKKAFDNEMDRWITEELGSDLTPDAIRAFKEANDDYREFSVLWRSGDAIDKLVKKDKQGYALQRDPQATANVLWNASEAGFINNATLRHNIRKLKEVIGPDSPEFQDVADALAYKALKLEKGFKVDQRVGSLSVKGTDMWNHWDRVKRTSGDVLSEVYSPQTLDAFDNFVQYARMMDTKLKSEADMPISDSSQFVIQLLKRFGSATFRFSRAAFQEAAARAEDIGSEKALREFYGDLYLPRGMNTPRVAAGATVEALWQDEFNQILAEMGYEIPGYSEPLQIPILDGVSPR